jgi:hypothetical protein
MIGLKSSKGKLRSCNLARSRAVVFGMGAQVTVMNGHLPGQRDNKFSRFARILPEDSRRGIALCVRRRRRWRQG